MRLLLTLGARTLLDAYLLQDPDTDTDIETTPPLGFITHTTEDQ